MTLTPLCTLYALLAVSLSSASPGHAQQRTALRTAAWVPRMSRDTTQRSTLGIISPLQQPHRRSESARLGLQFLAASAGAVGGGLLTYSMLRDVSETRVKGDEGYTRSGNVGYLVGSFAGATLGAHAVGKNMGGKAPLWATAIGALVGTVPLAALGVDEPYLPLFGVALGWIPQAALAAGGFNMAEAR